MVHLFIEILCSQENNPVEVVIDMKVIENYNKTQVEKPAFFVKHITHNLLITCTLSTFNKHI